MEELIKKRSSTPVRMLLDSKTSDSACRA